MSKDDVVKFRLAVNDRPELQHALREAVVGLDPFDLTAFAAKHGYDFTRDELLDLARNVKDELTDFELEMVAGGVDVVHTWSVRTYAADPPPGPEPMPEEDKSLC